MTKHYLKLKDLWWVFAYPIYQIIGTIRHEGAHALVGWLQGAEITSFNVFPKIVNGQIWWGSVSYFGGNTNWLFDIAPYFFDLFWFILTLIILLFIPIKRHWIWINIFIFGIFLSLFNSFYNYLKHFLNMYGDVTGLFFDLPNFTIHLYFIITILIYITACIYFIWRKKFNK